MFLLFRTFARSACAYSARAAVNKPEKNNFVARRSFKTSFFSRCDRGWQVNQLIMEQILSNLLVADSAVIQKVMWKSHLLYPANWPWFSAVNRFCTTMSYSMSIGSVLVSTCCGSSIPFGLHGLISRISRDYSIWFMEILRFLRCSSHILWPLCFAANRKLSVRYECSFLPRNWLMKSQQFVISVINELSIFQIAR